MPSDKNARSCAPKNGAQDDKMKRTARNKKHSSRENGLKPVAALLPDQRQKFLAGLLLITKGAQHGRSYRRRVLFFHSAHHHAKMPRLDHNPNALWLDRALDALGDLRRQPLLHLQAPCEGINQAVNLAPPNHLPLWNIRHMR